MAMRKQMIAAAMAATGLLAMGSLARAALVNPSFEDGFNGWTTQDGGGYYHAVAIATDTSGFSGGVIPDGTQYAFLECTSGPDGWGSVSFVYQDVGALQPNTTYTLTAAIGVDTWSMNADGSVMLLNGTDQTGTVLASASAGTGNWDYSGQWTDVTITCTTGAAVSGDLVVYVGTGATWASSSNPVNVDNIRLSAVAVPEPTSLALVGLGGLSLLAQRRRVA